MKQQIDARSWLRKREIESVELIVPDMAGALRAKMQPASQISGKRFKLPIALFGQTINGTYHMAGDNVEDRDMVIEPDFSTLRLVPWATETTAAVMMDCLDIDGGRIEFAPRAVLQRVLELYAERGWRPVVAPEVEFYLLATTGQQDDDPSPQEQTEAGAATACEPYGTDRVHDLGEFFQSLSGHCRAQEIDIGAVSQELGPGQFEVNFNHGDPLRLADDVFHFKRTLKRVAKNHGLVATFLAKLDAGRAGSSLHVHQSVYNEDGDNIFSNPDGEASDSFAHYLGGLQAHMKDALLLFAPYPNSYRRFLSYWSSPVNLEWDVDNRTVGLRVPDADPQARRIENRLAGSDVNPYLAIAGTLACGLLGIEAGQKCRPCVKGSAYDLPFALHRSAYEAIDGLRGSDALRKILGDEFVTLYTAVKELECREFQERIPHWEREEMIASV